MLMQSVFFGLYLEMRSIYFTFAPRNIKLVFTIKKIKV